jgi:5-formyltetrahydrofolate cyclo-ligase
MTTKFDIRNHIKAERLALSPDVYHTLCSDICSRALGYLLDYKTSTSNLTLAGYATTRNEADVFPMLEDWCSPKHAIRLDPYLERLACLPRMQENSKRLSFHRWEPESSLILGKYQIAEPVAQAPELLPDIVLVPLIAFDRKGGRIGYGGGYYDATLRYLRENHRIMAIGLGFGFQEIPTIPLESFDEPLNMVITEREIITCG